jgi:glycosyltransferase involved in cell wall biosynthesis
MMMRVLFIHRGFPAQFANLATHLAVDPDYEVKFLTTETQRTLAGIDKQVVVLPSRRESDTGFDRSAAFGKAVFTHCKELLNSSWCPDVVYFHGGSGAGYFLRDVFPSARIIGLFEWYYRSRGSDADFLEPPSEAACLNMRVRNAVILMELDTADCGVCATHWQKSQFPEYHQERLQVLHEGIDTRFFSPAPRKPYTLPNGQLIGPTVPLVTFATRALEDYRGFPQFLDAAEILLAKNSDVVVVVAGRDETLYGRRREPGYWAKQVSSRGLDPSRFVMAGLLPVPAYRELLQNSSAHVYLTVPFVLSWSCLQAMACGALLIASSTPPVQEVIRDGENGILVDFFDTESLADQLLEVLESPGKFELLRQQAAADVRSKYSTSLLIPQHVQVLER